ncbi:DUF1428 domain-containing protein [Piscinibacter gummiphilus]|uniref:DUF1428 domain-containing protein n=1 Tax=Piscinibacter gummiphilus TaxID=946333 RepID=A0ABZ0CUL2_9BURK|nr:DUF1428 domain-containing protein [Piscinibacter gummiphilus]WOB08558.1 DUF1428 domain-containing protein [Piscinibacter gummiphilus]
MPHYVDGFLLAVPKDKVEAYRKLAQDASVVWKEHGAVAYFEGLADDVQPGKLTSFPQAVQLKDDEVVIFSWIVYNSREQRDEVNAKVMADPRIANLDPKTMPFDGERMIYGGFSSLVEA